MKRCLTRDVIRKLQIKTTMRFHNTPITMAKIQNLDITEYFYGVEEQGLSLLVRMKCGTLEDNLAVFYQTKHTLTILRQSRDME